MIYIIHYSKIVTFLTEKDEKYLRSGWICNIYSCKMNKKWAWKVVYVEFRYKKKNCAIIVVIYWIIFKRASSIIHRVFTKLKQLKKAYQIANNT